MTCPETGTFIETSMPVVDYYRKRDPSKVIEVDTRPTVDEVHAALKKPIEQALKQ